jgi:uncharacterized membrane protein
LNAEARTEDFVRDTHYQQEGYEMNTKTQKMYAEIIERLDRIEKALLAYFASATINQASAHDYVADAVRNFVSDVCPKG